MIALLRFKTFLDLLELFQGISIIKFSAIEIKALLDIKGNYWEKGQGNTNLTFALSPHREANKSYE